MKPNEVGMIPQTIPKMIIGINMIITSGKRIIIKNVPYSPANWSKKSEEKESMAKKAKYTPANISKTERMMLIKNAMFIFIELFFIEVTSCLFFCIITVGHADGKVLKVTFWVTIVIESDYHIGIGRTPAVPVSGDEKFVAPSIRADA